MNGLFNSAFTLLLSASLIMGGNRLVFTPKEDQTAAVNPHKGFVQPADEFDPSSSCSKLTNILYSGFTAEQLKSGDGFMLSPVDSAADKAFSSGRTLAAGISAKDADSAETMKKLAKALSARYDGSEKIEFIFLDIPQADESIRRDILESWDSAFRTTPVAIDPDDSLYGKVTSKGIIAYDIDASLSESELYDGCRYFPLTEASCKASPETAEAVLNRTGYNFTIKFTSFYFDKNEAVLSVKIGNTGSASADFPLTLEAAVCDKNGTAFTRTGGTAVINADSLAAGSEQTYELRFDRSLIPNKKDVYISLGAFEDTGALSPDIVLANKTTGNTNYVILGQIK